MLKLRHPFRTLGWVSAIVLIGLTVYLLVWRYFATPLLAERLSKQMGRQVSIGSMSVGWGPSLKAHNIRVRGVPPFEKEILAVMDHLSIRFGGQGKWLTPSEVVIDGLDLFYLGTPYRNNLFSPPPVQKKTGRPTLGATTTLPRIVVRSGRVMGHFAFEPQPRIDFRIGAFQLNREPTGLMVATIEDWTTDIQNRFSFRIPHTVLSLDTAKNLKLQAASAALQLPGGGSLLRCDLFKIETTDKNISGECLTPSMQGVHTTRIAFNADRSFARAALSIHLQDLDLHPLGYLKNRSLGFHHATGSLVGNVTLNGEKRSATYELDLKVQGFDVNHPAWDQIPWSELQASATLRGSYEFAERRLVLSDWKTAFLGLPLEIQGYLEFSPALSGEVKVATPAHHPPSCAALWQAQPEPFRQTLSGLGLDGFLGFRGAIEFDSSAWERLSLTWEMDSLCTVKSEPSALADLFPVLVQPSLASGKPSAFPLGRFHPDYFPLAKLPRHVLGAFTTSEDSKFYRHNGFDLDMIRTALAQDLESRSMSRGASTITQQLAKNLFLTHHRTLVRKLQEAILAWRLHRLIGKDRTLELYLNIIELGPGIQGIRKASITYFGKEPSDLMPLESAHLAALTPNPHVLARRFRDGQVDEGWMQRLYDLLGMMKRMGRLSPEELAKARKQTLSLLPLNRGGSGRP